MGKAVIFVWLPGPPLEVGVGLARLRGDGIFEDGDAGSAAARARKTA